MRSDGRKGVNVRTVINGINKNNFNKRNNKAQRYNGCTVSRMVIAWKMFTFGFGSYVSLLFFFLFELFGN